VPPPNVFTIAPDRPFLDTLARGLMAFAGDDPLLLPRMTVLLPTQRAARSLREAFLRLTSGVDTAPLLLPRLRPIGGLDNDELGVGGLAEATLAIPPAIPELRRLLLLTRLVLGWSAAKDGAALLPGQAAALAAALARLLADADLRQRLGAAGRAWVRGEYEWTRSVERMVGVYRELLAAHGAAAPRRRAGAA